MKNKRYPVSFSILLILSAIFGAMAGIGIISVVDGKPAGIVLIAMALIYLIVRTTCLRVKD